MPASEANSSDSTLAEDPLIKMTGDADSSAGRDFSRTYNGSVTKTGGYRWSSAACRARIPTSDSVSAKITSVTAAWSDASRRRFCSADNVSAALLSFTASRPRDVLLDSARFPTPVMVYTATNPVTSRAMTERERNRIRIFVLTFRCRREEGADIIRPFSLSGNTARSRSRRRCRLQR